MNFMGAPGIGEIAVAGLAAVLVGYGTSWALDRLLLRRFIADRMSAIALSCAAAFVVMMAAATVILTMTSPFENGPIIIPSFGYAVSFVVGTAVVGIVRVRGYADEYEHGEDQLVFDPDEGDLSRFDDEVLAFDERHGRKNYLRRHWAGHLPLTVSYWVNGALLSAAMAVAAEFLLARLQSGGGSLRLIAFALLAYFAAWALFWVWSSVGIWRSAYWHRRRGGSPGWGVAARTLILLGAVGMLFRSGDIALQAAELGTLAAGGDSLGEVAEMRVSGDGRELIVRGNLASGAAARFEPLLAASPRVTTIVLTSPGGRILEAERISAAVRARRLDTRVVDYCMSACTDILLAGRERTASEEARIGFHQPSFPGLSRSDLYRAIAAMRARYLEAGVESGFVSRAMITPAEAMWYPDQETLIAANVLTGSEIVISHAANAEAARRIDASRSARVRRDLAAFAAQMNRQAPVDLDAVTRMERAVARENTLTTVYSLRMSPAQARAARPNALRLLHAQVCRNPQLAAAVRDGGRFVYEYRTIAGQPLLDVAVERCPRRA